MLERIPRRDKATPIPSLCILAMFWAIWAFDIREGIDDFPLMPVYLVAYLAVGVGVLIVLVRAIILAARKQWRGAVSLFLAIPLAIIALQILSWTSVSPMSLYLWYRGYRAEALHSSPPPGETKRVVKWRWGEIGGMGTSETETILVYDESGELQQISELIREDPSKYSNRIRRLVGAGRIRSIIPEGGQFYLVRYFPE